MKIDDHKIADLDIYLTRMQRSILDKMFFIDKVFDPFRYVLDFGCANGELIKALQSMCADYEYVGYDISEEMIEAARKNVPNAAFYSDWNEISLPFDQSMINISSTVHEVYAYGTEEDVALFWDRVLKSGFRYIAIRDMMYADANDRKADASALAAVRRHQDYAEKLADFEACNGRIETQKQLVHFLLKYKYTQNWEREVRENYFPLPVEKLLAIVPQDYRVTFFEHFTLPYTAWQIRKDFGFDLKDPTHVKIILEKK